MAFPFGADKGAGDTISAADLNTYLRDNLLYLKTHYDNDGPVHGIVNPLLGGQAAAMHIEAHRSAEQCYTEVTNKTWTFTWTKAFSELVAVVTTLELTSEYHEGWQAWANDIITTANNTGCTVITRFGGTGDEPQSRCFRMNVIAIGYS